MSYSRTVTFLALFSFLTAGAVAQDQDYFSISSVEHELVEESVDDNYHVDLIDKDQSLGSVLGKLNRIIAIGEKIYKIIEKGQPVVNLSSKPINIVPMIKRNQAVAPWELEGWSRPVVRKWKTTFKNLYGMTVVSFTYALVYSYGGSYEGKGAYLANVQIVPEEVDVAWGYNMDMEYKLVEIINHGRRGEPVVGAVLGLHYKVKTVLKSFEKNITFHVQGKGRSVKY